MQQGEQFLPLSKEEAQQRGWDKLDFVLVSGDAYVDHPSFGPAIIGRVLEAEGFSVGIIAQPDIKKPEAFAEYGVPKYAFLIAGGNVDSMVAHYTVARRRRNFDEYSPGGKAGARPDRVVDVYGKIIKQNYPDVPVIAGGLEASLRRFAHYDYWDNNVRPSILETSGVDMVLFGMGERPIKELAHRLASGESIQDISDLAGSAILTTFDRLPKKYAECASFTKVKADKLAYAKACRIQLDNQDPAAAVPVVQKQSELYLVQNLPAQVLSRAELDKVYALPYTRKVHPAYEKLGGVPALEEVEFSLCHNRGCFGGCSFCAIALHQGLRVSSRSEENIVEEAEILTKQSNFKGYIHDVGGPTANFRMPSCAKQIKEGVCKGGKHCLAPSPCPHLRVDHSEYLKILRRLRKLPGVKKVFIRSGIRYDYVMKDKDESFFEELVKHHVSGQLKVAPEHASPAVLRAMGKPSIEIYNSFSKKFYSLTKKAGKPQFLVPYLMSSHPGSTLKDAILLAEYLADNNIRPEQVQDFYPTPGTVATSMYYTELDPYTLKKMYVAKKPEYKALQRAMLQYFMPQNRQKVLKALSLCDRNDLVKKLLPMARKDSFAGTRSTVGAPGAASKGGRAVAQKGKTVAARGKTYAPKGKTAKNAYKKKR